MSPAAEPGAIRSGKLAGRSMWSAIWILALPVLLQQTMAAFIGLVDMIYAGRLPPDIVVASLDAISIGAYVGWFVSIAMTGLGIGAYFCLTHERLGWDRMLETLWQHRGEAAFNPLDGEGYGPRHGPSLRFFHIVGIDLIHKVNFIHGNSHKRVIECVTASALPIASHRAESNGLREVAQQRWIKRRVI